MEARPDQPDTTYRERNVQQESVKVKIAATIANIENLQDILWEKRCGLMNELLKVKLPSTIASLSDSNLDEGFTQKLVDALPSHPLAHQLKRSLSVDSILELIPGTRSKWNKKEIQKVRDLHQEICEERNQKELNQSDWAMLKNKMLEAGFQDRPAAAYRLRWENGVCRWDEAAAAAAAGGPAAAAGGTAAAAGAGAAAAAAAAVAAAAAAAAAAAEGGGPPWDAAAERRLLLLAARHGGHRWEAMAAELGAPGRGPLQCLQHYQRALNPQVVRRNWTPDEEKVLARGVACHGKKSWKKISLELPGRTKEQCRQRWRILEQTNRKSQGDNAASKKWTTMEERRLFLAIQICGEGRWVEASKFLPGRSDQQCREKWLYGVQRAQATDHAPQLAIGKGPTRKRVLEECSSVAQEDKMLQAAVAAHGEGNWKAVAAALPPPAAAAAAGRGGRRTAHWCRRRWLKLQGMTASGRAAAVAKKVERDLKPSRLRRSSNPSCLKGKDFAVSFKRLQATVDAENPDKRVKTAKGSRSGCGKTTRQRHEKY